MFFRSKKPPVEQTSELEAVIAQSLPDADPDTQNIVTAIAGLLGCVSYADRSFSAKEQDIIRNLLQTIQGISPKEASDILSAIERNIIVLSTTTMPRYARVLKDLGNRDMRLHVLDMLLDVAAVDHDLSNTEVVYLRQVTQALGLEQADYNDLQSKHRDVLTTRADDPLST